VPCRDLPLVDRFLDDLPLRDPAVRRVALVRLRVGLGDLLCSAPALRALRRHRPDLETTLVTWPEMAPVVDRLGHVHGLLSFPGMAGIPDRPPQPELWEGFVADARERRFDLALQCYGDNPVANTVAASLGARLVGGFSPTGWSPPPGTERLHLPYPVTEHEVRRHLALLQRLGLPVTPDDERLSFPVSAAEEDAHARLLGSLGLESRGYAVLHPGASSPSRRWPVTSFAVVARRLHAEGLPVVVTGSPGEVDLSRELARRSGAPVLDMCGRTDLPGLALLLRDAAVLVGNDTGTAHLAAAVGARSVTVFQPGDPRRWGYDGPSARALVPHVACAPCPHLECPIDFRCSRATTPDRVLSAVREVAAPPGNPAVREVAAG
jgi:ADP-heptose:LPS heptosyltransferase